MYQGYRYNRAYPDIPGHTTDIPRHTSGIPAKICFLRTKTYQGYRYNRAYPDIPPTYPDITPAYPPKCVFVR